MFLRSSLFSPFSPFEKVAAKKNVFCCSIFFIFFILKNLRKVKKVKKVNTIKTFSLERYEIHT
jgi:hypothetical protein